MHACIVIYRRCISKSLIPLPVLLAGEGYNDNSLFESEPYIHDHIKQYSLNGSYTFHHEPYNAVFVSFCTFENTISSLIITDL